jgi:hypothetical protein
MAPTFGVSLADYFHAVATGPRQRRRRLTPLGLLIFGGSLTDQWLALPRLAPGARLQVLSSVCRPGIMGAQRKSRIGRANLYLPGGGGRLCIPAQH